MACGVRPQPARGRPDQRPAARETLVGKHERPPRGWRLLRLGWRRHPRIGVLGAWALVEAWTAAKLGIHDLRPGGLLRASVARHRGAAVRLRDGTVVAAGTEVLELHLDNDRLGRLAAAGATPWELLEQLRADLRALAASLRAGRFADVRALHGLTLLAAAGPRLGFELVEPPRSWSLRLHRFFFAGLVALHNRSGPRALARKAKRWPADLWLSRGELLRRYGDGEPESAGSPPTRESEATAGASPTSALLAADLPEPAFKARPRDQQRVPTPGPDLGGRGRPAAGGRSLLRGVRRRPRQLGATALARRAFRP
jgi:hypothetical protein